MLSGDKVFTGTVSNNPDAVSDNGSAPGVVSTNIAEQTRNNKTIGYALVIIGASMLVGCVVVCAAILKKKKDD